MPSPLPRRSHGRYCIAHPSRGISLPRKGDRVGLRIVFFEAYSAFTRVTACTLALSPICDSLSEGFSHFVTSMTAPLLPAGAFAGWDFTHWKAPPYHGAHPQQTYTPLESGHCDGR